MFINCLEKYDSVQNALKNYPQQDKKYGKKPKFVYFTMKKTNTQDLDYFSKMLYRFMQTMGVRPYFVNLNDNQLLGIVPKDAEIDTNAILSTFSDAVESIEIKETMNDKIKTDV
jgi:hypothetical protein